MGPLPSVLNVIAMFQGRPIMFENAANQRSLFKSESALSAAYLPDEPVKREAELREVADAMRPLKARSPPENVLLYGPSGTGKTTVAKHVLDCLADETRVATPYINCWQYNTRSSLLTELLIQLNYPAPRKGNPVDELLGKLREWLTKHYGAVVVLDEVDQLEEADEVLYDLHQISEEIDQRLGLILISNRSPVDLQRDSRTQSRIALQPIEFRPYTKQDLGAILEDRADHAFRQGAVSSEVLEEIAATVVEQSGDCREALNLLLRAGRQAECERAEAVTLDHVNASSLKGY